MRTMEIPCFPRKVEINNLEHLYKTRLKQKPELQAAISIPLLGYMGWPNDPAAREHAMQMIRTWLDGEEPREFLRQIPLMHQNWGRVASSSTTVLVKEDTNNAVAARALEKRFFWAPSGLKLVGRAKPICGKVGVTTKIPHI